MNKKEFYKEVKNRNVRNVFMGLENQLERGVALSGSKIHRKETLRHILDWKIEEYDRGYLPKEETFEQYRQRDPEDYELRMEKILEGIKSLGLKI